MDNRINLLEYLTGYRTVVEKRKVFYAISREMHRLHNNGEYLTKLSFETVSVCFTNSMDIKLGFYGSIGKRTLEEVMEIKRQNMLMLARLMIVSFLDGYDYKSPLMDLEIFKNNGEALRHCYHGDDFRYFEKIVGSNEFLYYDEFIESLDGSAGVDLIKSDDVAFANYFVLVINLVVVLLLLSYLMLLI